jgi:molybdate transport system substrate-binding protein
MTAPRRTPIRRVVAALTVAAATATGCTSSSGSTDDTELVVLAASSLTEAFERVAADFEAAHADVTVVLSFASSSTLAAQAAQGAPADVLATASPEAMDRAVDAGAVDGSPRVLARNRLVLAVPPGNPAGVTGLADLGRDELRVALCAPEVPCGAAASRAFEAAGVTPAPDTLESDVKATLTKVLLGEVDAGLVYGTDVLAAGDAVRGIDLAASEQAATDYVIAPLAQAPKPEAARAFVAHVESAAGQQVLADAGFDVRFDLP